MNLSPIRIGSRKSELALLQANHFMRYINQINPYISLELVPIVTSGDTMLDKPLDQHTANELGIDKGFFTKELEEKLLQQEIDLAVHSLKDLPTVLPAKLELTAISERGAIRDLLISRIPLTEENSSINTIHDLMESMAQKKYIIGTSSQRRIAQLKYFAANLQTALLRGNVATRIGKLISGQFHAILLAEAGISRILGNELFPPHQPAIELNNQNDNLKENQQFLYRELNWKGNRLFVYALNPQFFLPACGQGFLGIEIASDNQAARECANLFHGKIHSLPALAEREFLATLEAGCHAPVAAYSYIKNNKLFLIGKLFAHDGSKCLTESKNITINENNFNETDILNAQKIGRDAGAAILQRGGTAILKN